MDVLISLFIKKEIEGKNATSREVISYLSSIDLSYSEIAKILGKTPSYVASELTVLKKKGGKNAGTKKAH